MANVDTRLKRQSATCILVPPMLSGVYPDTSGVVQAEKQAVSWCYSGILAVVAGVGEDVFTSTQSWVYRSQMRKK